MHLFHNCWCFVRDLLGGAIFAVVRFLKAGSMWWLVRKCREVVRDLVEQTVDFQCEVRLQSIQSFHTASKSKMKSTAQARVVFLYLRRQCTKSGFRMWEN